MKHLYIVLETFHFPRLPTNVTSIFVRNVTVLIMLILSRTNQVFPPERLYRMNADIIDTFVLLFTSHENRFALQYIIGELSYISTKW